MCSVAPTSADIDHQSVAVTAAVRRVEPLTRRALASAPTVRRHRRRALEALVPLTRQHRPAICTAASVAVPVFIRCSSVSGCASTDSGDGVGVGRIPLGAAESATATATSISHQPGNRTVVPGIRRTTRPWHSTSIPAASRGSTLMMTPFPLTRRCRCSPR